MTLALIDADFLLYICTYHPEKELTLDEVILKADTYIKGMFINTNCTHYIGALTDYSFRYRIYPLYKANRRTSIKPQWFKELKDYLIERYKFIKIHDFEGDDIVYSYHLKYPQAIMVSSDKDIHNCVCGTHYNPITNASKVVSPEEADYNFWLSTLTGDTADNIKGIPGIGKATASKIIKLGDNYIHLVIDEYIKKFGELEGIEQFYINYRCLKLEKIKDEDILDPIPIVQ